MEGDQGAEGVPALIDLSMPSSLPLPRSSWIVLECSPFASIAPNQLFPRQDTKLEQARPAYRYPTPPPRFPLSYPHTGSISRITSLLALAAAGAHPVSLGQHLPPTCDTAAYGWFLSLLFFCVSRMSTIYASNLSLPPRPPPPPAIPQHGRFLSDFFFVFDPFYDRGINSTIPLFFFLKRRGFLTPKSSE